MKKLLCLAGACLLVTTAVKAQVLLSGGLTYSQNFDSMTNTPDGGSATWTDNSASNPLGVGWYAARAYVSGTTSAFGPFAYPTYRVGNGSANNGSIWSFGTTGASDRALGSIGSGTPKTNVFGVLFQNDTGNAVTAVTISYTGEEWRNGGNTAVQTLAFGYQLFSTTLASPLDTAPEGVNGWISDSLLNFNTPTTGATSAALDGNAAANRTALSDTITVTIPAGQEILLRWRDIDDSGNDHALAIDDLTVSFTTVPEPSVLVVGGVGLLAFVLRRQRR